MRQYLQVKAEHPDGIVFFRMGDFYEMFFEDAVLSARLLDLTLTSRDKGKEDAIPMAGVPHHAGRSYIARLTELGHKVVLVEQVEDPRQAKGLVKREVVRIITPGVVLDDEVLDPKSARYVAAVVPAAGAKARFGLAYLDASTGEFRATELTSVDAVAGELARVGPREVLADDGAFAEGSPLAQLPRRYRKAAYGAAPALEGGEAEVLGELAPGASSLASAAAARVLAYARATQPAGRLPVCHLQLYEPGDAVVLDEAAVANLELTETLVGAKKEGSLLAELDETRTAPGGRLLRRWLLYPLTEVAPIRRRQDAVQFLVEQSALRGAVRDKLRRVADLERLAGRFTLGVATPRDLGRLRDSLGELPQLAALLGAQRKITLPELVRFDEAVLAELAELERELSAAIVDEPPPTLKDGGLIREGHCPVVDENRKLARGGKEAVLGIEGRERERTSIPSLKVKYNKVFGYYIEVTKAHLSRVPEDYVRKQTITTAERYVTPELAELEGKILSAEETLIAREQELMEAICRRVTERAGALLSAGARVAAVDCLAALAELAEDRRYVRPEVEDGEAIDIVEGRHPVVERAVETGTFVPNDCSLDTRDRQILLITGPNMAGKSTYMRQVAHTVLLAQIGSFVPAARARIGLVDRIFTRVGAADNLARGESTFMVEMRETSAILAEATRRSLVVLDEVGRGTSTFDGVSIAWAVTEHLHDAIGARTLFATHYHELCALAESRPRVHNVSAAVREHEGDIVFLRQVVAGGSSRSYGIDVARLAGLPPAVVLRARQILGELEGEKLLGDSPQLALFGAAPTPALPRERGRGEELAARLEGVDPDRTTPLEALQILAELRALMS